MADSDPEICRPVYILHGFESSLTKIKIPVLIKGQPAKVYNVRCFRISFYDKTGSSRLHSLQTAQQIIGAQEIINNHFPWSVSLKQRTLA